MSLEEELADLVAASGVRAQPVVRYLGLDGGGGTTLQVAGDENSITRERVRQLAKKATDRLKDIQVFAPRLDEAMSFVSEEMPEISATVAKKLMVAGISRSPFDPRGLIKAASLANRDQLFMVSKRGLVVPPDSGDMIANAVSAARRAVSARGVATIAEVAAILEEETEAQVSDDLVVHAISSRKGFRWLDRESGWFWLAGLGRNRLLNFIEKVMSVADAIDISELRAAVGRHHRMRGFAPPSRVLLELCNQLDAYSVDGRTIRDEPPIDWAEVLGEIEQTFVRIFHSKGPLLTGAELEEYCVAEGMNRSSFYVYLGYSPIVARYARTVYGLVGADVAPGEAEALVPKRRKAKVVEDFGWTANRRIWIKYKLSENLAKTGVISIPAPMRKYVRGDYSLMLEDGVTIGSVSVRDHGSAWGLYPFLSRRGGEVGDRLLVIFDGPTRCAQAFLRPHESDIDELIDEAVAVSDG